MKAQSQVKRVVRKVAHATDPDPGPRTSSADAPAATPPGPPKAPVLIFLPLRPRSYVAKLARIVVAAKTAEFGETILQRDVKVITQDLLQAGADPEVVKREVRGLEASIRAEIWRTVLTPEGEG